LRGIKDSPPYLDDRRCFILDDTLEYFNPVQQIRLTAQEENHMVVTRRTTPNKFEDKQEPSKPASSKPPDIASASVPATLAAIHVNPGRGLTYFQVDTCHAAIQAITEADFVRAVRAEIGFLFGFLAVG
jgi:hypothetical protein